MWLLGLILNTLGDMTNLFNDLVKALGDAGSGIIMIKGVYSDPKPLDERFRVENSFVYMERYNGTVWEVLGTWGGSFESDKIYLYNPDGITGLFYKQDEFAYTNFARTTSKHGGYGWRVNVRNYI